MEDEEPNWKDELNVIYTHEDYIIHKTDDGKYMIINEKIMMGIMFDSAEWCCPFDNWTLFLDEVWVGVVILPEDDDFLEALEDIRMKRIEERVNK